MSTNTTETPAPLPAAPPAATGSVVYLIHFKTPYRHARHYTGWTAGDLQGRLAEHAAGRGARLMAVIVQAGIDWTLARTWEGTRKRERQLKRQGGASRRCPICRAQRRKRAEGLRSTEPTTTKGQEL